MYDCVFVNAYQIIKVFLWIQVNFSLNSFGLSMFRPIVERVWSVYVQCFSLLSLIFMAGWLFGDLLMYSRTVICISLMPLCPWEWKCTGIALSWSSLVMSPKCPWKRSKSIQHIVCSIQCKLCSK